jgi:hypothetical protein
MFKETYKNNFQKDYEFKRKKNACILVAKYVIIIEVYCIWNDIVIICGYCILWLDLQLF